MGCGSSSASVHAQGARGVEIGPVAGDDAANPAASARQESAPRRVPRQTHDIEQASGGVVSPARLAWEAESAPFVAVENGFRCTHSRTAERHHALCASIDLFTHALVWASPAAASFMQQESIHVGDSSSGPVSLLSALTAPSQRTALAALARARARYDRATQLVEALSAVRDGASADARGARQKLVEKLTRDRVCEVEYAAPAGEATGASSPALAEEALAPSSRASETPTNARLLRVRWRVCVGPDGSLLPRVCCDIEDLQRIQALLHARERIEMLETKLRNTSMFTRTVLHEVRVPFTSISSGITELDEVLSPLLAAQEGTDAESLMIPRSALTQALDVLDLMASGSNILRRLLEQGLHIQRSGDNRIRMRREPFQLLPSIQMCVQIQTVDSTRKKVRLHFQWYADASLRGPAAAAAVSGGVTTRRSALRPASAAAGSTGASTPNDSARGGGGIYATPCVVADDSMLERSVSNYISNAIKFSKRDSTVTVSALLMPLVRLYALTAVDVTSGTPVAPPTHSADAEAQAAAVPDLSTDEPSLFFVDKSRATPAAPTARASAMPPPLASAETPHSSVSGDISTGAGAGNASSFFGGPPESAEPAPAPAADVTAASPAIMSAGFSTESSFNGTLSARAPVAETDSILLRSHATATSPGSVSSPQASFSQPPVVVPPTVALALQHAQVELSPISAESLVRGVLDYVDVRLLLRHATSASKSDGEVAGTARAASSMHVGIVSRDAGMAAIDENSIRPSSASGSAGGRTHASTPMDRPEEGDSPATMDGAEAALARWAVACIMVTDTGPGISLADQHKLFQPYSQIQPMKLQGGGGTGLGLSIVQESVRMHGGQTGVISSEGAGATFFMIIPLPVAPPTSVRSASQAHIATAGEAAPAPTHSTISRWAASPAGVKSQLAAHVVGVSAAPAQSAAMHMPGAAIDEDASEEHSVATSVASSIWASSKGVVTTTTPAATAPISPANVKRVKQLLQGDEEEDTILLSGSSHSPSPPRHAASTRGRPPQSSSSKYDVSMHAISIAPPSSASPTGLTSSATTQTLTANSEVSARDAVLIVTDRTPALSIRALPRTLGPAAVPPPLAIASAHVSPVGKPAHVLVIDDDVLIQRVCKEMVTRHAHRMGRQCTVHCCSTGMEGIAYVLQLAGRASAAVTSATLPAMPALTAAENDALATQLALICVDYSMPGMQGPAIVHALRYKLGLLSVKMIGLTGHADEHTQGEFVLAGAADVLVKPFDARDVLAQLPQ